MQKKLTLFLLSLFAFAAFATEAIRRAGVTELVAVSEETTWDFSKGISGGVKFENDAKNVENIYANIEGLTFESTFKADALAFTGEYPLRSGKTFAQNGTLHFKTTVAGTIVVKFSDTGSSASEYATKRYLVVNDAQTEYWTSRENNGTDPYAAQLNVTTDPIDVPAGDVTIKGTSAICVYSIAFTPNPDVATVSGDSLWSSKAPVAIGEGIENITLKAEKVKLSSKFAAGGKIKVGIDEITSTDDPLTKESATIQLYAGKKQLNEQALIGTMEAPGVYEFTLTGAMVKAIADNDSAFTVKGTNFKTSKIAYEAGSAMEATSVWVGTAVNKLVVPGYVFENIGINVGSYIKIKAAKTALTSRRADAENDEIILKKAGGAAFSDDELKIDEEGYNAIVLTDGAANELKFNGLVVEVKDNSAITKFTEVDVVVGKAITLNDAVVGTGSGKTTVPSAAAPGQTVTIKPAPASGSVVLKVEPTYQVTTDEGTETKDVNVAKGKDESDNEIYTFTMPDYPVDLKVTYAPAPEDITVTMDAAGDLSAAIDAAFVNKNPNAKSMTINLNDAGTYTLKDSIPSAGSVTITGKDGAIIDASASSAPFIQLSKTPAVDFLPKSGTDPVEYTDYYDVDKIHIEKVKVVGLKNSIFYDNNTKYCVDNFTIDNAVFELATEKVANEALIAFQGGGAKDLTIKNSTFYGNNAVAKYFVRYNNSARIDRYGYTTSDTWSFTYEKNTFYGLLKSDGQWGNYSGIVGKNAQGIITIKDNIWYNCDKETMRRLLGSKNFSTFKDASAMQNNTFWYNNAATDQGNYGNSSDLVTDPQFVDAANADFHLGVGSQQAKFQTGDPRWLTTYDADQATPVDLTVEVKDGEEIAAAINAAITDKQVDIVGNLTVKLAATSTITSPIEIGGVKGATLTLTGSNGSTIDASGLADAFIQLSATPKVDYLAKNDGSGNTDYYGIDKIKIDGVKVTGLKNSIFYDNNTKYCVVDFTIDNAVFELATEKVANEALIAFQSGGAKDLTIKNSTFYGNNAVAKYFVRYNNSARIDRYGYLNSDDTWSFTYEKNTFYGLLNEEGQWGNYSGIVGNNKNAQGIITINDNIWYNCDSQTMRRLLHQKNFSTFNAASAMQNNTFWYNNAATDQGNYGNGTDLTHDPGFVDAANGDFHLGAMTAQAEYQTGDPRWLVTYVSPENTDEMIALAEEIDKAQTLLGNSDTSVDPGASLAAAIQQATALYSTTKYADQLPAVVAETAALQAAENTFADNVLGAEIVKAQSLYDQYKSDCASPYAANNFYYEIRRAISVDRNSDQYTGQELNAALLRLIAAEEAFLTDAGIDPSTYVTGIEGIKADNLEGAVIYDLNGKRVEKPGKGLYIVNGKKVVIK